MKVVPVPRRAAAMVVALAFSAAFDSSPVDAAPTVERADAARAALSALGARRGEAPLTVFGLRSTVRSGSVVTQAGPDGEPVALRRSAPAAQGLSTRLVRAGVRAVATKTILRATEPSWLFYADHGPSQAFEHRGRVVLVGARSGTVRVSRQLRWVPLVDGRLPAFFRSPDAYDGARYRVFDRPWKDPKGPAATAASARAEAAQAAAGAEQRLADALAAERSCALRVSDTLGDFYDYGRVDRTRAGLGRVLKRLSQLNPGFVSQRYTPGAGRTPVAAAERLLGSGCRDLLLYAAGGGTRWGAARIVVGVRPAGRSAVRWHELTATDVERLVRAHRDVTFKLVFDAPYAGRVAARLRDEPNVDVLLTAGGADEPSFTYLPQLLGPAGIERNPSNPLRLLEFTNGLITGLERLATRPDEVDRAIAERAAGRSRSVLAWMLARALGLAPTPLAARLLGPPDWLLPDTSPAPAPQTPQTPPAPAPANAPPVITGSPAPAAEFAENGPSVVVDGGLTVTDADSSHLRGARVEIAAGHTAGDILEAPPPAGIDASYDAASGVLTLTGSASVAAYESALRSVRFGSTSEHPGTARTIRLRADDGHGLGPAADRAVTVLPENDAPQLTVPAAQVIDEDTPLTFAAHGPREISVADPDAGTGPVSVTVTATAGTFDVLLTALLPAGNGTSSVTLTGTLAQVNQALDGLVYTPAPEASGTATVTVTLDDLGNTGAGGSQTDQRTFAVQIVAVDDPPVVTTSPGAATWQAREPAVAIDPQIAVSDLDSATIASAEVRIAAGRDGGDVLTYPDDPALTESYAPATGVLTVTGPASPAVYQAFLRQVTFSNPDVEPSTATRTVTFTVTDDAGKSGQGFRDVQVRPANVKPTVTTQPGAAAFVEDGGPVTVDGGITTADDGTELVGATVTIAAGGEPTDTLAFTGTPQIDGTYDAVTRTLTLTGTATVAQYQAALRTVAFTNGSDAPSRADRTIRFVVDDGKAQSDPADRTVTVTAVNDAPTLSQPDEGALTYTEDAPSEDHVAPVAPNLALADPDSAALAGATVEITAGLATGDELVVTAPGPLSGSYDAGTGRLTLSGAGTVAQYQAALRSVAYRTTDEDPSAGPRTITFRVDDGDAEHNTSNTVTRAVEVEPTNDAPTPDDETFTGADRAIGNTALVVDAPGDGALAGPAGPRKAITGDVLAGDTDPDSAAEDLSVVPGTLTTDDGGTVTIESDGDFVYLPRTGTSCTDTSDRFEYTVIDGHPTDPKTATGRVTIELTGCVWYVDGAASAPPAETAGSSHTPLTSLDALDGAGGSGDPDGPNQTIFIAGGAYTGGLQLENGQRLLGERHGLTVAGATLQAADPGAAATRIDGGVTVAAGNTLQGIDLGATGSPNAFALSGASVGTLTVNTQTPGRIVNPTGGAVSIGGSGNTLDVRLDEVSSSSSATSAITIANASGTFEATGGLISDAAGADVVLSGGSLDVTLGATISDDTGQLVAISNQTGGTKRFTGPVDDAPADGDGGGVTLTNNAGATIRFDNGLNLSTGATAAFTATGGGTVVVTDPDGAANATLETTTGTALRVANTAIGSDGLTFERIASNGAPNGIVLSGTGSAGGLTVTGAGGTCTPAEPACSGGTIEGSSGPGIALTDVGGGVRLTRVRVHAGNDDGIRASNVTGLELADSVVTANGNAAEERGLDYENVTGSATIARTTVSGSAHDNARLDNDHGAVELDVASSTFASTSTTTGKDGLQIYGDGTATVKADILDSTFTANRGDGFRLTTSSAHTAAIDLNFSGNTITGGNGGAVPGQAAMTVSPGGSSRTRLAMVGNVLSGSLGAALILNPVGTSQLDATVATTTVGPTQHEGISVKPAQGAHARIALRDNTIRDYWSIGLRLRHGEGNGTASFVVQGNTVTAPSGTGAQGLVLDAGTTSSDTAVVCAEIGGTGAGEANDFTGSTSGGLETFRIGRRANATLMLPGHTGADADLLSYFQARNAGVAAVADFGPGEPLAIDGAPCTPPTPPPAP